MSPIGSSNQNKKISLPKLLPNIFTTIGLCSGLTGIRFALDGNWQNAVFCILVAACFDMIDGLSARLLKAFSPFGAELDSLADTISFGVSPAIITFLWIREPIISTDQGAIVESVLDNYNGFIVDALQPIQIANALKEEKRLCKKFSLPVWMLKSSLAVR